MQQVQWSFIKLFCTCVCQKAMILNIVSIAYWQFKSWSQFKVNSNHQLIGLWFKCSSNAYALALRIAKIESEYMLSLKHNVHKKYKNSMLACALRHPTYT